MLKEQAQINDLLITWVQVDIPTCHFSERFLFRTVFIPNGIAPKGCFSEQFLFRKIFYQKIRNKNLSE